MQLHTTLVSSSNSCLLSISWFRKHQQKTQVYLRWHRLWAPINHCNLSSITKPVLKEPKLLFVLYWLCLVEVFKVSVRGSLLPGWFLSLAVRRQQCVIFLLWAVFCVRDTVHPNSSYTILIHKNLLSLSLCSMSLFFIIQISLLYYTTILILDFF